MQHGVSKRSGKPYSMVTLEDLEGSVQLLCMNENYEKYRELLVPNKAILVVGEVNAGTILTATGLRDEWVSVVPPTCVM